MANIMSALLLEDRWSHRFNIFWFSITGVALQDPVLFFMGMYLLTEYMFPEGVL